MIKTKESRIDLNALIKHSIMLPGVGTPRSSGFGGGSGTPRASGSVATPRGGGGGYPGGGTPGGSTPRSVACTKNEPLHVFISIFS